MSNVSGLVAALADSGIARIVLAAGMYVLDAGTACNSYSWLCVGRAVTIEAAETGTVVVDAAQQRRGAPRPGVATGDPAVRVAPRGPR